MRAIPSPSSYGARTVVPPGRWYAAVCASVGSNGNTPAETDGSGSREPTEAASPTGRGFVMLSAAEPHRFVEALYFYLTGGHTPTRQDGLFSSTSSNRPEMTFRSSSATVWFISSRIYYLGFSPLPANADIGILSFKDTAAGGILQTCDGKFRACG